MSRFRPPEENGFGVAETLIAAAISAVVLAAAYQLIASNAQAAGLAAQRRAAVLVAQSALELTSVRTASLPRRGRDGDYVWSVSIGPFKGAARDEGLPIERVDVRVRHASANDTLIHLRTLRIAR